MADLLCWVFNRLGFWGLFAAIGTKKVRTLIDLKQQPGELNWQMFWTLKLCFPTISWGIPLSELLEWIPWSDCFLLQKSCLLLSISCHSSVTNSFFELWPLSSRCNSTIPPAECGMCRETQPPDREMRIQTKLLWAVKWSLLLETCWGPSDPAMKLMEVQFTNTFNSCQHWGYGLSLRVASPKRLIEDNNVD